MADIITAKVYRYDPSVDAAPRYETYEVEWQEDGSGLMSALQVLTIINETQEMLGYDSCCHSGLCGRCAMLVDGVPTVACLKSVAPGEHTFEPLPGFPVVRDLIVDKDAAYQRMMGVDATIHTTEPITGFKPIEHNLYWNTLARLNMCRECMCCEAAITLAGGVADPKFVGVPGMMQIAQRYLDGLDESDRLRQAVDNGLFADVPWMEATAVCSGMINIAGIVDQMKADAEAAGLKPQSDLKFF